MSSSQKQRRDRRNLIGSMGLGAPVLLELARARVAFVQYDFFVAGTILVIEDDDDTREGVMELLRGEGYEVEEARNGAEGLALLESSRLPNLVILDLMMPVMTGQQLLAVLRNRQQVPALPVVITSAFSDPQGVDGARRVLRKPVHIDVLLRVAAEFCQQAD